MGTAVLMEKLGLKLTVHDITYVYRLQKTGRDQYTLVTRNSDRKLVTELPDSSKSRDEDFLVITGNWQNPPHQLPLNSLETKFTAKKVEFVERKTVEHLLRRPCFIDSGSRPRSTPILLGYEPSYKSFQSGPTVKDSRQAEVTVSQLGKDQEEIIQAVPLTARREMQVSQLVTPFADPNFVPSIQPTEVGLPVIRTLAPESSETSHLPPPLGFPQREDVMRRRKRGEEKADKAGDQQPLSPSETPKAKAPKKRKSKNGRARQKVAGHVSHKHKHWNDSKEPWSCAFLIDNRPIDEDDSVLKSKDVRGGQVADAVGRALLLPKDMKVWQEKRFEHMLENLKRDSILAVQGMFEAGSRLLENEHLLNQSLEENKWLKDLEKLASVRIQVAESMHKSAEAGLMTAERQAANSLKSQLVDECNTFFLQGWHMALDKAGVDDVFELYDLAPRHRPLRVIRLRSMKGGKPPRAQQFLNLMKPRGKLKRPKIWGIRKRPKIWGILKLMIKSPWLRSEKERMA
uniref:Uncharacterized protein n=1 Tax=Fagus sylvatica TaxID=28930 RepID=A0A2N9JBB6_FAGSY